MTNSQIFTSYNHALINMGKGKPKKFYQQYTQCLLGNNKKIEKKNKENFRLEEWSKTVVTHSTVRR